MGDTGINLVLLNSHYKTHYAVSNESESSLWETTKTIGKKIYDAVIAFFRTIGEVFDGFIARISDKMLGLSEINEETIEKVEKFDFAITRDVDLSEFADKQRAYLYRYRPLGRMDIDDFHEICNLTYIGVSLIEKDIEVLWDKYFRYFKEAFYDLHSGTYVDEPFTVIDERENLEQGEEVFSDVTTYLGTYEKFTIVENYEKGGGKYKLTPHINLNAPLEINATLKQPTKPKAFKKAIKDILNLNSKMMENSYSSYIKKMKKLIRHQFTAAENKFGKDDARLIELSIRFMEVGKIVERTTMMLTRHLVEITVMVQSICREYIRLQNPTRKDNVDEV